MVPFGSIRSQRSLILRRCGLGFRGFVKKVVKFREVAKLTGNFCPEIFGVWALRGTQARPRKGPSLSDRGIGNALALLNLAHGSLKVGI